MIATIPVRTRLIDLTGQKFGRLTVIERAENKGRRTTWLCVCDCGNKTVSYAETLRRGDTKSCGCYRIDKLTTHGNTSKNYISPTYRSWVKMIQRCTYLKDPSYENYGARGIKVCGGWLSSFENFLADVGKRPSVKHSIDRIDVNGDYEPGNCRWATRTEQNINQRMRKDNTTGQKGVYYDKRRGNWYVRIAFKHTVINVGTFDSVSDATKARKEAEQLYWGEMNGYQLSSGQ